MGLAKLKEFVSVEDYLVGENDGDVRHEYIYGGVYAMAGASDRHNRISFNCAKKIDDKLDPNGDCQVFLNDMKLQADEATFYYPDVFVACDNPDSYFRREPILIIEVLSPSTERADRHEKLRVCQQISTLQEYVIVAQDKMWIEVYQKQKNRDWIKEIYNETGETFDLTSVNSTFTVAKIYRGVNFESK